MKFRSLPFLALPLVPLAVGCSANDAASEDAGPAPALGAESPGEPVALAHPDLWRGWNRADVPAGWVFADGTIHLAEPGAGDLITKTEYDSFVLELSWRIEPGGNSGIFFHATEEGNAIYESAPEMQVLDDSAHADSSPVHRSGANYGLHPTNPAASLAAGLWNHVTLTVDGDRVTQEQNGYEIVSYTLGSPEWEALVAGSKFSAWPIYGRAGAGHIGLQDHGNQVWFRDLKITPLR